MHPTQNFITNGILIGYATNLGRGLGGVLARRNLSRSSGIPISTTRIVGTPQMVFTNLIMTTYVNRTLNQPSMNSIIARRYINTNVGNLRRYRKPSIIIARIFNHRKGHSMRPNRVALWP